MKTRKVGIIGLGHVGAHVAYSLAVQGIADEHEGQFICSNTTAERKLARA